MIGGFNKKSTEYVLTKMFRAVGATYSESFCREPQWFTKYSWTQDEQDAFVTWLVSYLRRRDGLSKDRALKEAAWFCMHCGWSISDAPCGLSIVEPNTKGE